MTTNLSIMRLEIPSITVGVHGIVGNRSHLGCALKGLSAMEALLANFSVEIGSSITFSSGEAFVSCSETVDAELPLEHDEIVKSVLGALGLIEEVKERYHLAYKSQTPTERTGRERQALAFNRSAHALLKYKGSYTVLHGSDRAQRYIPVDPHLLECPEPVESRVVHIDGALVAGSRDACGHQLKLPFDGGEDIDVLVSIKHAGVSELLYATTLEEGQNYWKKATRITCDVVVETGKIPRVMGKAIFNREE